MLCPSCKHENRQAENAASTAAQDSTSAVLRAAPDGNRESGSVGSAALNVRCRVRSRGPISSNIQRHPAAPGKARAGERRQLTVMFCDLVGSTLSASGSTRRTSARSFAATTRRVRRSSTLGRHVATYMGDGLLVYFGYPQAREDDAERAVRAGLEIVAALRTSGWRAERRIRLAVRVGIHTGPVVVGELGRHGADIALGDTIESSPPASRRRRSPARSCAAATHCASYRASS